MSSSSTSYHECILCTPSHIMNGLATCALISESMRRDLGRLVLQRSQWLCLLNTYSAEIQALIDLMNRLNLINRHDLIDERPLLVLQQALQEGRACMQAYIPVSSSCDQGNYNSWLVDKALKHAMSTDVVDLHLHNFLWASSIVRQLVTSMYDSDHERQKEDLVKQAWNLHKIWSEVDADEDLRIAKSFLIKLKGKYTDEGETCQLVDFILQKLFHMEESPHNHVTPGPLPSYMCILHSNQCLHRNTLRSNNNGTAEVSEVEWLGGRFVLKSFKQLRYFDEENFKREAAIQARVWHPHVVPLVCCTNEPPGLLMELMQEDLDALIERSSQSSGKDSPFPQLLMAVDLMLQIAKGMEYLHSDTLRIIHRDLKPANIFVNSGTGGQSNDHTVLIPQVHLKIGDFGVSKAKHECSEYTTRDQGTTLFMAPEVYGDGISIDEPKYSNKADVYSFGMVCYAILTRRQPFYDRNIRKRVKEGERPSLPLHCPRYLSSFIEMCWHADPTKRPTFIQICRMLRYFKACILLQDCNWWLLSRSFSLSGCTDEIDAMMEHCLAGRILEPKALGIPLEMYFSSRPLDKIVRGVVECFASDDPSLNMEFQLPCPSKNPVVPEDMKFSCLRQTSSSRRES